MKRLLNTLIFARELKKLWNMMVTVIPIVVSALKIVPKDQGKIQGELEIRRRIEIYGG